MANPFLDAIRRVRDAVARRPALRQAPADGGDAGARGDPSGGGVPVVDVEGLIGLKLPALVNDPTRQRQDESDIVALLTQHLPSLDQACWSGISRDSIGTMTSRDPATRPAGDAAEPLVARVPDQRALRPEPPVRSVEEFALFLAQVEAVVGPDVRPRRPTLGRFVL